MARIVVSGYMLRLPLAGNMVAFLQYLVGLHDLGHEVIYLEEKGWPYSCFDPLTGEWTETPTTGLARAAQLVSDYCPGVPVVFVDSDQGRVVGMGWPELRERLRRCDLLLDVGGNCWFEDATLAPRRALVDCDPMFTQTGAFAAGVLDNYQRHFSYGTKIGAADCSVPTLDLDWWPAAPPVVPRLWPSTPVRAGASFRTVANWSAYGGVSHDGDWYGQKDSQFLRVLDLAHKAPVRLEIALSGAQEPVRQRFRDAGWLVRDGGDVTQSFDDYRSYILGSVGEFSVAKHAYVAARSGWFSDRTVAFLASGRAAVIQDTGFSDWLPTGRGVFAYRDPAEAAAGIEAVAAEPALHSAAAHEIAQEFFDYRVVLGHLLDAALPTVAGGARS
jgi:hypothetical protein